MCVSVSHGAQSIIAAGRRLIGQPVITGSDSVLNLCEHPLLFSPTSARGETEMDKWMEQCWAVCATHSYSVGFFSYFEYTQPHSSDRVETNVSLEQINPNVTRKCKDMNSAV